MGQFVALWESIDAITVDGTDLGADRIGLAFFSSGVPPTDPAVLDGGTIFRVRGTNPPGPTHNWQDIVTQISTRGPGGGTAMGAGLQLGLDSWTNILDSTKNDATIVLMSDGIQNQDPQITTSLGGDQQLDPDGVGPRPVTTLFSYGIPTQTVSFGVPGSPFEQRLDQIAQQTGIK